jgi:YHS domain-containing protein
MKRHILAVIMIAIITTVCVSALAQGRKSTKTDKAKDPVCGLMVEKDPALSTNYKGKTYYFCSKTDAQKFKKEPEKYLKKNNAGAEAPHFH